MGQAANFSSPAATPLQSKLDAEARTALNEPLNILQMGCWDGIMVIKAGIERANSVDPKLVAKALPEAVVETSYGPITYGGSATYGSPQQLLLPVIVTQIKNGDTVEIKRVISNELPENLRKQYQH
jgi:branched-chain amino acid transport system substrate-binding protein